MTEMIQLPEITLNKGCIFDLDGTLLDSLDVWREVDDIFLSRRGLKFTAEYGEAVSSLSLDRAAEHTIRMFNLEETPKEIISEWLSLAKEEYALHIKPIPFGREFIHILNEKKIPMAVATSGHKELYMPALKRLGIIDCFKAIADCDTVNTGKDSPDVFLAAAGFIDKSPEDCIVFEDTVRGLQSAKSAGFTTVGILDAKSPELHQQIKAVSDFAFFDFRQLTEMLINQTEKH